MNLKHLHYFWSVAHHGGVLRASEVLHISPQTISGQIKLLEDRLGTPLFTHEGRRLVLNEAGRTALKYADDIFALTAELEQILHHYPSGRPLELRLGISDILPKSLVYRLLRPAIDSSSQIKLICREGELEHLLAELAIHRLDIIISDTPIPDDLDIRAQSHVLGESSLAFLVHKQLWQDRSEPFPLMLNHLPLLLPGANSRLRRKLNEWIKRHQLRINLIGEFDDSALMAAFGRQKAGVFAVPEILLDEFTDDNDLVCLGVSNDLCQTYFAHSAERRSHPPLIRAILQQSLAVGRLR